MYLIWALAVHAQPSRGCVNVCAWDREREDILLGANALHSTLLCYGLNTLSQFLVSLLRKKHFQPRPMWKFDHSCSRGTFIRTLLFYPVKRLLRFRFRVQHWIALPGEYRWMFTEVHISSVTCVFINSAHGIRSRQGLPRTRVRGRGHAVQQTAAGR